MLKKQFTLHSTYKEVMNFNSEMKNLYSLSKLNEQHQKELEIVQVESLNNIVRHSYLAKPNGIIQVEVRVEKNIWDISKIKKLDWHPRYTAEDSIKEYLKWLKLYQSHG